MQPLGLVKQMSGQPAAHRQASGTPLHCFVDGRQNVGAAAFRLAAANQAGRKESAAGEGQGSLAGGGQDVLLVRQPSGVSLWQGKNKH